MDKRPPAAAAFSHPAWVPLPRRGRKSRAAYRCLLRPGAPRRDPHWVQHLFQDARNRFGERRHKLPDGFEEMRVIGWWIGFHNTERPHPTLGVTTPARAYRGDPPVDMMDKPLRALPTSPQAHQQRQGDRSKEMLAA